MYLIGKQIMNVSSSFSIDIKDKINNVEKKKNKKICWNNKKIYFPMYKKNKNIKEIVLKLISFYISKEFVLKLISFYICYLVVIN